MPTRLDIPSPVWVNDNFSAKSITYPAGSIADVAIASNAKIDAQKQQHRNTESLRYATGTTPVAKREVVGSIRGTTGTVRRCWVQMKAAVASGTFTVDLIRTRSGTPASILSATLTINSTNGLAYATVDVAGFSAADLLAGDVLEINVTVSSPSGGDGSSVFVSWDEDPS